MSALNLATTKFIDTITNPIDCLFPGLVPDGNPAVKLNLRDRYDAINSFDINMSFDSAPHTSNAFVIWLSMGYDEFVNNSSYDSEDVTHRIAFAPIYNDVMVKASDSKVTTWVNEYRDDLFSYIKSWRYLGGAFRIKSIITNPTVTSSTFITSIRLAQLTSADIYECWNSGDSVASLFNNAPMGTIYEGGLGATVRHFMLENDYLNNLGKFGDTDKWKNNSDDMANTLMPAMYVIFNNSITATEISTGSYTFAYPCQGTGTFHLEGVLDQPSPLFGIKSPSDIHIREALQTLNAAQHAGTVPWHATYHSFKKFSQNIRLFAKHARIAARTASKMYQFYNNNRKFVKRAVRPIARRLIAKSKRKKIDKNSKRLINKARKVRRQANKIHSMSRPQRQTNKTRG